MHAHELADDIRRLAVMSCFAPEVSTMKEAMEDADVYPVNGERNGPGHHPLNP